MIAKFHSAPGHSMETTLTINIPPPERIRAAKGERLREKQKDKVQGDPVQGSSARIKDDETTTREKEEERVRDDREREREKFERERRALAERGTSYKDKFQKMKEKYGKVVSTHETHIQELDILTGKIQKLHAENDLLLDAVFLADTDLYDRHFPSGPGFGPPPIGHPGRQRPPQPPGMSSSSRSYHSSKSGHGHAMYAQQPSELPMNVPLQPFSSSRYLDNPTPSSSGPSAKLGHYYYHQPSHGQNVESQEQSQPHPLYAYPPREPILPDPIHPPAHHRQSQHSTYRHYVLPSDHHGMPPPPPPIPGSDGERERQREWEERERERARREWEWEREGRHPTYKELGGLPPTPPLVPPVGLPPPSNGYHPMTPNGHGYVHGSEYGHSGHSLPPLPSTTRRHSSRATRSNSSRSASRRRNEGMKMEMDVDADMSPPSPSHDADRSLGGPVHLDVHLEVARDRERGIHSRSAEQDHVRRDSSLSGGRSRRSSGSQKPAMGHARTPPMGILEPATSEQLQPALDMRLNERRQSPRQEREREGYRYDRSDPARQFGHATNLRGSYEDGSTHPSGFPSRRTEDGDGDDYGQRRVGHAYEDGRRHDRDGVPGGRIESFGGLEREIQRAREEEEESEESEDEQANSSERKVGQREAMDVDEAK